MNRSLLQQKSCPLWVLDTNVVLDLLHFDDARARPILDAVRNRQVRCAVTQETLEELRRVLSYPAFGLTSERQAAVLDTYQSLATQFEPAEPTVALPRCSDPDDQKFLELAAASGAQGLVTKDRALLKLRRRCVPYFQVMTPIEAAKCLAEVSLLPAAGT